MPHVPNMVEGYEAPPSFTSSTLIFSLNSTKIRIPNPNPELTLLEFIRAQGLTGSKLACGEGGCGACTVVVGVMIDGAEGRKPRYRAVNACLAPLIAVHGAHVITVEGIGSVENPHPIQERMAQMFGSQCGFCTPGIVASLYATILNGRGRLTEQEIEESLDGNLCRCTGYRPILDAAKTFASDATPNPNITYTTSSPLAEKDPNVDPNPVSGVEAVKDPFLPKAMKDTTAISHGVSSMSEAQGDGVAVCGKGKDCCRVGGKGCGGGDEEKPKMIPGIPQFEFKPYDHTSEPLFPPYLKNASFRTEDLILVQKCRVVKEVQNSTYEEGDPVEMEEIPGNVWLRPGNLQSLVECMRMYPSAKIRSGNSETGIEVKFKAMRYSVSVYVSEHLRELAFFQAGDEGMTIGGALPLTDVIGNCKVALKKYGDRNGTKMLLQAVLDNLKHFAGTQIRNQATISGNIATASPISDLNPVWVASDAVLTYIDTRNSEGPVEGTVEMRKFFLGYRKTALPAGAVVKSLFVPFPKETDTFKVFTKAYKQSKRKDDDIAIVTSCLRVALESGVVREADLCYGGMGAITTQSTETNKYLVGKNWGDQAVFYGALEKLASTDYALPYSVLGGMPVYRKSLALGFFARLWADVAEQLSLHALEDNNKYAELVKSEIHRGTSKGFQDLEDVELNKVSGKSVSHLASLKQVTGEAQYTDDFPPQANELYAGLVLSQKPHAKIRIDATKALAMEGVVDFVSYKDVKGSNIWNPPAMDEVFFAEDEVFSVGQTIGAIIADTKAHAQAAARAVVISYEELPFILTIDEAIAAGSFFKPEPVIKRGDVSKIDQSEHVLSGTWRMGGQEHFYFETNACVVLPHPEDGETEILASTQNPTETQVFVSSALGVPQNRVVCRTKRLGGGFGGKETRSIALSVICAVAARKVMRPVRCQLDRDEDMIWSGQRHPFMATWKVGFSGSGKLESLDIDIYNNGGWSQDLSQAVLTRAMFHIDGCYTIPNVRVAGKICKTNTVSNTAFRGFGGPQGIALSEAIMTYISEKLQMPGDKLRELNMYKEAEPTHFGQPLIDWNIPTLWNQLKVSSDYERRAAAVEEHNKVNRWKKRGISILPTKFGISFTALMLNQAHALVHIYQHDGSVLLAHGGVEMGQGLHTKMAQVCATELGISLHKVHIIETNTTTAANTSATAASAASDLNGMAIKNACDQLNERLQPFREKMVGATWEQIAHAAYFDRVDLSANGFYKTPDIGYDFDTGKGNPFFYFTQGAAVSEVEVDCLTGDWTVLRADVHMDIGRSINPGVDIGQIEGAYTQGMGLMTMEESLWLPSGQLFTRGPGAYKIPSFLDTPQDFRISFLKGPTRKQHHLRTIQSSKGVGEPPTFLGATVFFAIKDAVGSRRKDEGLMGEWVLDSPATPERIRLGCGDEILKLAEKGAERKDGEKGFFVSIF